MLLLLLILQIGRTSASYDDALSSLLFTLCFQDKRLKLDTNSAGQTSTDVSRSARIPVGGHRRCVQKPKGGKPPTDPCDTAKRYPLIL